MNTIEKKCPGCKQVKPSSDFYKAAKNKDGLQSYCKICKKEKFKINKEYIKEYNKKYNSDPENRKRRIQQAKDFQKANPEKQKAYQKKHQQTEKAKETRRAHRKKEYDAKYGKDMVYTLKLTLRNRLKSAVKNKFKKGKTIEMLGCSIEDFILHIEQQFTQEMNWDNYGSYWELDHIIPLDHFNLEDLEEQKKGCIFTNIQPLTVIENRIKSNKL